MFCSYVCVIRVQSLQKSIETKQEVSIGLNQFVFHLGIQGPEGFERSQVFQTQGGPQQQQYSSAQVQVQQVPQQQVQQQQQQQQQQIRGPIFQVVYIYLLLYK